MAIELITTDSKEVKDLDWFYAQEKKAKIDLSQKPLRPEGIFAIGKELSNGNYYPNWIMSKGELSVISAPSKSFKSTLKSQISATSINRESQEFTDWMGNIKDDESIIDIDTEQGKFYAWHTFNRTKKLFYNPGFIKRYHPYKLRHLNPSERVKFIDHLIATKTIKKPALIFIDGIADLIEDTNDLLMSNEVVSTIMKWTDDYNIHINLIIHNAYGTLKPTGHAGSSVVKKAETVMNINEVTNSEGEGENYFKVTHQYSRGAKFDDFYFEFNEQTGFLKQTSKLGDNKDDFKF